ncbi:MAG: ATP-binding protein [Alphaproteobacteria bacterium]
MKQPRLKARDKDTIIQALNAGVVPRLGLQHVQVGRAGEVQALVRDIERVADGGAAFRLVIGEYGSGKTFFLNLIRLVALERKLVVASADLGPDRRLHATGGQARSLYAELTRNLSTRTKPNGGALASIVERFVADAHKSATAGGQSVEDEIDQRLAPLQDLVSGYDFTSAVAAYWRASDAADDEQRAAALRWLRGEFGTKTEARQALNVRSIIDDSNIYDYLKLMAGFVRIAGYGGLLVTIDEMVNLYKLQSTQARSANFEQLLRMLNDVLQGNNGHLGFVLGGTPEFLMDTRRGLYSYEALQSRLAENRFATDGLVDMSGPVLRLQSLTQEELFVLLGRIRSIFALGDPAAYLVPDDAFAVFMEHCSKRIGEAYFRTPRTTIKAFVNLLSVIEQNPGAQWQDLLGYIEIEHDRPDDELVESNSEDDELTSFKL